MNEKGLDSDPVAWQMSIWPVGVGDGLGDVSVGVGVGVVSVGVGVGVVSVGVGVGELVGTLQPLSQMA